MVSNRLLDKNKRQSVRKGSRRKTIKKKAREREREEKRNYVQHLFANNDKLYKPILCTYTMFAVKSDTISPCKIQKSHSLKIDFPIHMHARTRRMRSSFIANLKIRTNSSNFNNHENESRSNF